MGITRAAADNLTEASLRDSFGNVRTIRTETDRAVGLLDGVDVQFGSQAAQIGGTQGLEQGIRFTAAISQISVSAGTGSIIFTVAEGLWSLDQLARMMNADIADPANIAVNGLRADVVEGEIRLSYQRPASVASTVPNVVVIGDMDGQSDRLGLIRGTYSGFVDGKKDTDALEWGFSLFMATAAGQVVQISVSNGIAANDTEYTFNLVDTVGVADMASFITVQSDINDLFATNSTNIRLDQVGSAIAFTSTLVGTRHIDGQGALSSQVSLNIIGTATENETFFINKLGINAGTAKGSGDSNFRLHVVNSQPQFQIGADQGQSMQIGIADLTARALGVDKLDMTTVAGAQKSLSKLNKAIDIVSSERSKLGSFQNRLEYAVNNLRNTHSNLTASESRIRDADIAHEMIEFTRNQIVSQSGTAMLAQANLIPQGVLQLLQ